MTAGSSTRTPRSTRFDFVGIPSSRQTFSIHLLPLLPTEMMHLSQEKLSSAALSIRYPPSFRASTFSIGVSK